jgi:glycosyltransferase involved in cell wall biosynthesis
MLALRNDTGLRATVSAGALRLAAAFNWDNIAQQHAAVYRKLLLGSIPR